MNNEVLKKELREIFIKEDPISVYFSDDNNQDEYDNEIDIIIKQIPHVTTEEELLDVVYQVFKSTFGSTRAGSKEKYIQIVNKIWMLIRKGKLN